VVRLSDETVHGGMPALRPTDAPGAVLRAAGLRQGVPPAPRRRGLLLSRVRQGHGPAGTQAAGKGGGPVSGLRCASVSCLDPVEITVSGVSLCGRHRRQVYHGLRLKPARYVPEPGRDWYVYYIAWPHMPGLVKIGATHNLAGRLAGHKRSGHYPQVLAIEPGSGELETERHDQFADLRVERLPEIFRAAPVLAGHIERTAEAYPNWRDFVRPLPWWLNSAITAKSFDEIPPRTGTTQTGNPCSFKAGYGTDHPGVGGCWRHDRA
jgi:hypothetical protein